MNFQQAILRALEENLSFCVPPRTRLCLSFTPDGHHIVHLDGDEHLILERLGEVAIGIQTIIPPELCSVSIRGDDCYPLKVLLVLTGFYADEALHRPGAREWVDDRQRRFGLR